ncbi:MAG: putative undecaprenyl-phosphate glycosyl-phosphate transferase [Frankiales bacterium]|nr:putative undecaprenyl-phosphate glycosyl-phosphate transferase [Frankiales bacterium]
MSAGRAAQLRNRARGRTPWLLSGTRSNASPTPASTGLDSRLQQEFVIQPEAVPAPRGDEAATDIRRPSTSIDTDAVPSVRYQHGKGRHGVPSTMPVPVGDLQQSCRWSPSQRAYVRVGKPLLDMAIAAPALVLLAPVFGVVAALIRVSLGRPVIFRQQRIGKDGRPFMVFKFRSMKPSRRSADTGWPPPDRRLTHKHEHDPRLTGVGRVIRRWSLDELPQLLNILAADMSLVGPRPELPHIVNRYEPWQQLRHQVRPGLTGSWQISKRGLMPMHECVDVDVEYVRNIGLRTDLRILARTPVAVLATNRGH